MDYESALSTELASIHPVFNVSMLKKFLGDPSSIVPVKGLEVDEDLSYEKDPVDILDRQVKWLRNKEVAIVNAFWRYHLDEGATWEAKADIIFLYPYLFSS